MRERPILFSGEMVRALLDGLKTQTRRVAKFQPIEPGFNLGFSGVSAGHFCTDVPSSGHVLYSRRGDGVWEQRTKPLHCPYGQPGDRLWVRETWGQSARDRVLYRASPDDVAAIAREEEWVSQPRWRPSIHMPRWASRITLEITDVRVERVQEISEEDAKAEGVYWQEPTEDDRAWARKRFGSDDDMTGVWVAPGTDCGYGPKEHRQRWHVTARGAFEFLWDSINAKRGYGWDANPWVWALSFRVASASPAAGVTDA